jgi:hypothetical protein
MKLLTICIKKLVFCLFLISTFSFKSFSQPNAIYYGTKGGKSIKAEVVKSFVTGIDKPQLRFKHTNLTDNTSWFSDFLDYVSDAGEDWRAQVYYDYNYQKLAFTHFKPGQSNGRNDLIMNLTDFSGCKTQVKFLDSYPLQQFLNRDDIIVLTQTILSCPPSAIGGSSSGTVSSSNQPRWSVKKNSINGDLTVTFETNADVLLHTDRDAIYPSVRKSYYVGDNLVIHPGQWAQVRVLSGGQYVWSLMSDADNR